MWTGSIGRRRGRAIYARSPKHFNRAGVAWLLVLHASRDGWQFTVLFSNTQRAHELEKTSDWVVVYFHTDAEPEAQCTIVPETRGPLEGDGSSGAGRPIALVIMLRWTASRRRLQTARNQRTARQEMSLRLAINLRVPVINAPDFMSTLREQLPTDPRYPGLVIEITEDEAISDPDWISQVSTQLKLYDVRISIDDFGTAHSSLSRLLELPCVELKLDRSFVSNCAADRLKNALCQTVVDLAHRVGSQVCAEGVETAEDLEAIIQMGCDTAQGYIFAMPMPPETFAANIIARPMQFGERFAHLITV
jgi:EAL domain-containing protein (putative c-di-GMP-specific phosphodiesterase class I)